MIKGNSKIKYEVGKKYKDSDGKIYLIISCIDLSYFSLIGYYITAKEVQ